MTAEIGDLKKGLVFTGDVLNTGSQIEGQCNQLGKRLLASSDRVVKDVCKGAATAATGRPGPLQDLYQGMMARGTREELARVTLTRKLTSLTLRLWKTGERYDPTKLTMQAR